MSKTEEIKEEKKKMNKEAEEGEGKKKKKEKEKKEKKKKFTKTYLKSNNMKQKKDIGGTRRHESLVTIF